ncbi:MAG: CRISPR-associated protein Cas5 [Fimbriimonadaceae bacterium]|nr:MAG: CRISPR-associated protein Cas5 [Fimbriimonadaceae bacterium]
MSNIFEFEIAGPMAMFMRPHSGSTPVSYPIPTGSAIRAMVESIALVEGAFFVPMQIAVCKPIAYSAYACNYGGPLRKPDQIKKNASYQHLARVLTDCCFQVSGECRKLHDHPEHDPARKLAEMLVRRQESGQSRFPVCLGWKEFAPTYFGSVRPESEPLEAVNETIEGYLVEMWDRPANGQWSPRFAQVKIEKGVCDLREAWQHAR